MGCFTTKAKQDHTQKKASNFRIGDSQQQVQIIKNQSTNSPQCLPLCKINGQPDLFNSPLQKSPSIGTRQGKYFLPDEEAKNSLNIQSIGGESPKSRYTNTKIPNNDIGCLKLKAQRLSLNAQENRSSYGDIIRNLKQDSKKSRRQRYSIQTLQQIF